MSCTPPLCYWFSNHLSVTLRVGSIEIWGTWQEHDIKAKTRSKKCFLCFKIKLYPQGQNLRRGNLRRKSNLNHKLHLLWCWVVSERIGRDQGIILPFSSNQGYVFMMVIERLGQNFSPGPLRLCEILWLAWPACNRLSWTAQVTHYHYLIKSARWKFDTFKIINKYIKSEI